MEPVEQQSPGKAGTGQEPQVRTPQRVVLLSAGGAEPSGRAVGRGRGCLQPPGLTERPLARRGSHRKATVMVTPVTCSPFRWPQERSAESALLGQHWDPPLRGLGSQDGAGSGQTPSEPLPVPLPQGTQPPLRRNQPVPSSPRPLARALGTLTAPVSGRPRVTPIPPGQPGTPAQNPAPPALFPSQVPLCHPSQEQGPGARRRARVPAGSAAGTAAPATSREELGAGSAGASREPFWQPGSRTQLSPQPPRPGTVRNEAMGAGAAGAGGGRQGSAPGGGQRGSAAGVQRCMGKLAAARDRTR